MPAPSFFNVPGRPAFKWWAVEVRFARPLTRRQVRRLEKRLQYFLLDGGSVGQDGLLIEQWSNKWPWTSQDGRWLLDALQGLPPARLRVCPIGYGCTSLEPCELGREVCGENGTGLQHVPWLFVDACATAPRAASP